MDPAGAHPPVGAVAGARLVAQAVTSGHGSIWTLNCRVPRHGRCVVTKVDPRTEVAGPAVKVPRPASRLFYGAGHVWVAGGRRITAVAPATGAVATARLPGGPVDSMAFHGDRAYAAVNGHDQVAEITPGGVLKIRLIEERGGPRAVVGLRDAIEVTNGVMNLVPIIFPGADTTFLAALQLGRPVIGAAGPQAAWVRRGTHLVRETLGSDNRPARRYVATPGPPMRVVMAGDGGCYVSLPPMPRRRENLAYFSRKALEARHPSPTDVHVGRRVLDFALDPAGGVVFIDRRGALQRWVPAT